MARPRHGAEESTVFSTRTCRRFRLSFLAPSFAYSRMYPFRYIVDFPFLRPRCALVWTRGVPWRVISTPVDQSSRNPSRRVLHRTVATQAGIHSTAITRVVASRGSLQKCAGDKWKSPNKRLDAIHGCESPFPSRVDRTYCSKFPFVR